MLKLHPAKQQQHQHFLVQPSLPQLMSLRLLKAQRYVGKVVQGLGVEVHMAGTRFRS